MTFFELKRGLNFDPAFFSLGIFHEGLRKNVNQRNKTLVAILYGISSIIIDHHLRNIAFCS